MGRLEQAIEQIIVDFAAGNHDQGQKSPYKERYGLTYYHFEKANDLFIVLDPGLNGWNIKGAQMDFLQTQLAKAKNYRHIFVFFHQLLWWSPDNEYASYQPNSLDGRSPEVNFWDEVMPLFSSCGRPVYCFAGDVGAHGLSPSFFTTGIDSPVTNE